ncbi:MAG: response regulator transcription factor [Prevotellaceae bacterium]|jgi:DNA-binding response OmpR family regulator|nr:response regulator transcription factor [Prevotellaceae bacterium]
MNSRILVVDDDRDICEILEFNLSHEGYDIACAYSAEEALEKLADYSLILLDVMMEGMSGYKLAETLRRTGNQTPIIFLTAKDTENDMLTGFSVGADDYISKPFSVKEVCARIKAVLKRYQLSSLAFAQNNELRFAGLHIALEAKEVKIDGQAITLTKTETELLIFLALNPGKIYSREALINKLWEDTPFVTERTVDVHINHLRKKLAAYSSFISSKQGYGYLFNPTSL